jgi:hypothetical protein
MTRIILFFAIIAFIAGCKQEKQTPPILLDYKILDDVSPVKVQVWHNNEFHWTEWLIDDVSISYTASKNKLEFVFGKEGLTKVQINATDHKNNRYTGSLFIEIPPIANKLSVNGFYTKNQIILDNTDDFIICEINYYNGIQYQYTRFEIPNSAFTANGTINLDKTATFDITGFEKDKDGDKFWAYFWLKGKKSNSVYFKSNFQMYEQYFIFRQSVGNIVQIGNVSPGSTNEAFLLVDWSRN